MNNTGRLTAITLGAILWVWVAESLPLFAAEAPAVSALPTTNVTATSASVRGTVNPNGATTFARFEWGAGESFTATTAITNLGSGTGVINVGSQITGLTAGVIYQYRVVASNALGVTRSRPVRFGLPKLTLLGANPQSNPLNTNYVDPGANITSTPVAITSGYHHNVAIKADGRVVAWGANDNGQTTVPSDDTNLVSIAAGDLHSLALRADGSVTGWGYTNDGAINIPASATNSVIAVAAGGYHSLALKADGTVLGWGGDWDGQSTVPAGATNVIALAAGNAHSLALRADGTVFGWGAPWDGQTDIPPTATNIIAIAAAGDHSLALRSDGTVLAWGADYEGQSTVPEAATNIVSIAAGYRHSLALKSDGTVMGWGDNVEGQSTAPPSATNSIALAAGVNYSIALRSDGSLAYWGIADSLLTNTLVGLNTPTNILIAVTGSVLTNVAGAYTLTYRATNILGFATSATRTVFIGDQAPTINLRSILGNGAFQLGFDFAASTPFTVLATTNLALPLANWTVLGQTTEGPAGHYQFTDSSAPNFRQRFYQVRTP